MRKENKWLYCPKCKEYPNKIIDRTTPHEIREEYREWSNNCYELYDTNDYDLTYTSFCDNCNTKLVDKIEEK